MSEAVDISPSNLDSSLIPACDSSNPAFCMMYSTYKLNKQGDRLGILLYQFWTSPLFHVQF